jgi:hypothetical protein
MQANASIHKQRLVESEDEPRLRGHPHSLTRCEYLSERTQCGAGAGSNRRALPATCDRANHGASWGQPANRFSRARCGSDSLATTSVEEAS